MLSGGRRLPPVWQPILLLSLLFWITLIGIPVYLSGFPAATGRDFDLYRVAALIGTNDGWNRLYDLGLQARYYGELGLSPAFGIYYYFASPPQAAWLALPFLGVSRSTAHILWLTISAASLLATWLLIRPAGGLPRVIHLVAAVAWYPVLDTLHYGQPTLILGAGVALSWRLCRTRPFLAGLVLAPLALKPHLGLLLPLVFLLRGHYRPLLGLVVAALLLELPALLQLGPSGVVAYAKVIALEQGDLQNRLLTFSGWLPGIVATALHLAAALVAAIAIRRQSLEGAYAAATLGSLLAAPYLHVADLVLLITAVWLLARLSRSGWWYLVLGAAFLAGELIVPAGALPFLALEVVALVWLAAAPTEPSADSEPPSPEMPAG